jgi:aspartyl-tRNA(Asn)/glutamyl-tRNA(Gln) amidotransferase subunit B
MQQAIDYEVRWQIEQIEDGKTIEQATVLFDPDTGETRAMRTKEDAADYRYFPDPDLPPLVISREWVEDTRAAMKELPRAMAARFRSQHGLSEHDAAQLTCSWGIAADYEDTAKLSSEPKLAANWYINAVLPALNSSDALPEISVYELTSDKAPAKVAALISRISDNTISNKAARQVFELLWSRNTVDAEPIEQVDALIEQLGLKQMSDTGELEKIIDEVLAANAKNVEEVRAGNTKAMNALVGQAMKATKGKANPAQVNELLKKKLA